MTEPTTPAPKPDLLAEAGELLKRYSSHFAVPAKEPNVILASSILAVAGELRDIHNVLVDLVNLLRGDSADTTSPAPAEADEPLCIWAWSFANHHWYGACGYQATAAVDDTFAGNGGHCPGCGAVIHRISEEVVKW